ncbi:MAG: N-acetyl-gamma-glutamyl-phosphate reductase, partial [Acidobacteria bacterium]|nr:N-acetyl-gamma-glutamyl-phosphate reductase [Acidobacteriota bacterium]MDW7984341.1 N-acetyl-gamma-glutamyl-phosphate reductase [Acidobacteriota bacterium]
SRSIRSYAPVGHRHTAEVQMALNLTAVHLSMTAVETVRGVLATCHVFSKQPITERDLWRVYRETYTGEPFVRIVHERTGLYRHPDPKVLIGSNYADVGWAFDEQTGRIVAFGAIDNLTKGAAGNAVQCLNLLCGFDERTGLDAPGLYPV